MGWPHFRKKKLILLGVQLEYNDLLATWQCSKQDLYIYHHSVHIDFILKLLGTQGTLSKLEIYSVCGCKSCIVYYYIHGYRICTVKDTNFGFCFINFETRGGHPFQHCFSFDSYVSDCTFKILDFFSHVIVICVCCEIFNFKYWSYE